jgi:hypothetical protein
MSYLPKSDVVDVPPRAVLGRLLMGAWVAEAVIVAAELGLADRMADGLRSPAELAAATETDAPSLARLLRLLASVDVVAEVEPGVFALTPVGACLREDAPEQGRPAALSYGRIYAPALRELTYSLRTGRPGFDRAYGRSLFAYLATDREAGAIFDRNMAGRHRARAAALCAAYDFSSLRRLVDVGGGRGTFATAILAATPGLRGTLFDLPEVVARIRGEGLPPGVAERLEIVGGDFFASLPGGDGYLLSNIIHDWDDERAVAILRTCRRSADDGARVLVVEEVLPPAGGPASSRVVDVIMLALTGGRERTAEEYGDLLGAAGWRLEQVIPLADGAAVVEGVAV